MSIRIGLLPQVATAHWVSHLHIMALAALFPVLPQLFAVGYVELGLALSIFNIVTALVQAPMGYAVDHYGGRRVLIAGVALGSFSFLLIALFPTYTWLLIAMALAGVANAVYHPADYALLAQGIAPAHMGKAFSVHTFAGFLGAAIAPVFLLGVATASEPRLAFAAAALAGFAALALLLVPGSGITRVRPLHAEPSALGNSSGTDGARPRSLLSPMILTLTVLFVLLNLSTSAIEKFSVASLMQGQGATLPWANSALTAFLFASAFGVLCGGALADRTKRHGVVAASAFGLAALLTALVATASLSGLALTITLGITGFLTGVIAPSRDMLVRAASPKGAEGKTFGIVSTGFNIGGAVGPIGFGWLLDHGHPNGIFWASVAFMSLTVVLTLMQEWYLSRFRTRKDPVLCVKPS
ncbi:MFS transporter [Pseudomonas oryzicola]|uniref:MFS transporter n=1 Tax=Pseudomonas oryzicola TaxID=485876 RepID=A0ABS6QGP4_9PSED|nr:MFS transporter [Pseudomonas oryzicola]MBV4493341.1 MFS transporter [Pseudomonas oryzicola]